MATILRAVIQGLEATFENNGVGGLASTFQLLEIAHTHYHVKDTPIRNDASPMSERNSPIGSSRDSLVSPDHNNMTTSLISNMSFQAAQLASPTTGLVAQLGRLTVDDVFRSIESSRERYPLIEARRIDTLLLF